MLPPRTKYPPRNPLPNLVVRIARLLRKPDRFKDWVSLAAEINMFGDTLPIEWQRCFDPRAMVSVLQHTDLAKMVAFDNHRQDVRADYLSNPESKNKGKRLVPDDQTTVLTTPIVRFEFADGRKVSITLNDGDPVPACDAIRNLIPSVSWTDLKA